MYAIEANASMSKVVEGRACDFLGLITWNPIKLCQRNVKTLFFGFTTSNLQAFYHLLSILAVIVM